jgi:hypothetical protein
MAGDGADMLICLGDMLLFLDYADHSQGIFADLYGAEHARRYIDLRTARRFDEARALTAGIGARLTAERGSDLPTLFNEAIMKQYAALFSALAEPAYLTYGNVDVPRLWDSFRLRRRRADLSLPDAQRGYAVRLRGEARRRRRGGRAVHPHPPGGP